MFMRDIGHIISDIGTTGTFKGMKLSDSAQNLENVSFCIAYY